MSKYLNKEDIRVLELINEEVKDEELKNKLLEIYVQSFRKEEHYKKRHERMNISIDQGNEQSEAIISRLSMENEILHHLVYGQDEIKELYKAISQLDEAERKLVWLFFFCEIPLTEIAKDIGLSKQALSKRKLKIEKKLRKTLKK